MKIRILNLLIILAAVLNVWYGWKLGLLYGPRPVSAQTAQTAFAVSETNITPSYISTCVHPEEIEELNRRIATVADQLARMNLPPDTVLVIRPDGSGPGCPEDPAVEAGLVSCP